VFYTVVPDRHAACTRMACLVRAPAPGTRTQRRQAARRAQPQARRIAERALRGVQPLRARLWGASYRTPIIRSSALAAACCSRLLASGRRPPATPRLLSGGTCSATSARWWRRSCRPRHRAPAGRPGWFSAVTPRVRLAGAARVVPAAAVAAYMAGFPSARSAARRLIASTRSADVPIPSGRRQGNSSRGEQIRRSPLTLVR